MLKIPRVESTGTGFLVVPLKDGAVNFDLMRDRQADPIDVDSGITPKVGNKSLAIQLWIYCLAV